ncbi:septum site-determining protein MinC [Volucribacter psittacicida]|uniref:Probable septum site-determining protein MinC n=1 Tax=Volucribacter psittacicida TaxID=203482 RepID=A0A4R1G5C2_9PAST|nr:septum site-determining protein MinC [Volucribacter psittacicida]TCK01660.1 septum site-determining protein MinC [Volucribacter psittacicida]
MAKDVIELKTGHFSSIFITLNSNNLTVIKRALTKKVKKSPHFFQNVPVILKFTPSLHKVDLNALKTLLQQFNIHLIGVSDWQNSLEKELILTANLPTLGKSQQFDDILPEYGYLPPKIIYGNLQAGEVVYAKNSDLIINGDVSQGAEVAAEGNIHIYGKLQGRAMAGVNHHQGLLYVQSLEAEFISVCQRSLYQQHIPLEYWQKAVMIAPDKEKLVLKTF